MKIVCEEDDGRDVVFLVDAVEVPVGDIAAALSMPMAVRHEQ